MHAPILETPLALDAAFHWPDEAACNAWASILADALQRRADLRHARIDLHGDLGAGKTTLVRHLLRALGATGRIKSPTYTVLEPYSLRMADGQPLEVSHLDLYRLAAPQEVLDAGLADAIAAPGMKLIEWPERAGGLLGPPDLELHLSVQPDDSRRMTARAISAVGRALLDRVDGAERSNA